MVLGIAEDFTSNVSLDSELIAIPSNGLYLNSGVHPSITVKNLLDFLPLLDVTPTAYNPAIAYGKFTTTRNRKDLVTYSGKIYQSLASANTNHQPDVSAAYWLETNIESLRIKAHIEKVKDRVYSALSLTRHLINNQYLYENAQTAVTLPNNYAAWIFEAKGSNYVSFRINQISLQKAGTTPVNVYVVNQETLVDTLSVTPNNGVVDFTDLNYSFSGPGQWKFIIDASSVYTNNTFIDPLKYDGFTVYTAIGIGTSPQTAKFNYGSTGNGLGLNVSAFLDASVYVDNNLNELGNFVRAAFEMETLLTFLVNANNRSNATERLQGDKQMLLYETSDLHNFTVAKRFVDEKSKAMKTIQKSFDTQLFTEPEGLEVDELSV